MRHNKKRGMKLGTDASHTKAMKKSLVQALFKNDRIKTLSERAKAIRPELVREVFEKAAQGMWADRQGGYTRIMKLGPRKGDAAEVVIIELVTEPVTAKAAPKKAKAKATKVAPAKAEKVEKDEEAEKAESDAPAEETSKAEEAPADEKPAE